MRTDEDARPADTVASTAGEEGPGSRGPVAIVAGLLTVLHLWLALRGSEPSLLWDGLGYLGNARWLGGVDATPSLGPLGFYHAGYSLLLTPVTVLSDDPTTVLRAALLVNAASAVGAFVVLVHLARSFLGLASRPALVAAAVAALYPPVVLQTGFEWSESLFAAAFTGTTALVWWYARRRSLASALALGAAVAGLYLVHPRALALLPLTVVLFLFDVIRRRSGPVTAGAGILTVGVAYVATTALHHAMQAAIYAPRSARTGALLGNLVDPSMWATLATRAGGQLWYLLVATLGLGAVGVVVLLRMAGDRSVDRDGSRRLVAAWLLAAVLGVLVASVLQMAEATRVDHHVYGRYLEATAPVLLVAGLAGALGRLSRRVVATAIVASAALAGLAGLGLWSADAGRFTGSVATVNVFGVMVYDRSVDVTSLPVLRISLVAGVVATGLAIVASWRPFALAAVVAIGSLGVIADLELRVAAPFKEDARLAFRLGPTIADAGPDDVAMSDDAYKMLAMNGYQHENPTVVFEQVAEPLEADHDLVVHYREWPEGAAIGARRLAIEPNWDLGVWVLPGGVQDRLDAAGLLEPLSASARPPGAGAGGDDRPPLAEVPPATTTTVSPTTVPPVPTPAPVPPPPASAPTPDRGDGTYVVAPGASAVVGTGALRRFTVEVEGGLGEDPVAVAAAVESTLLDERSWAGGAAGGTPLALQRVSDGPVDFRVVLASPATTDELCAPLQTNRIYSCHKEGRAVVNLFRWREGAEPAGLGLDDYRDYVVNHEVGHALGQGHRSCPAAGAPAPAMMQQTKGIGACAPNPWPLVEERGG